MLQMSKAIETCLLSSGRSKGGADLPFGQEMVHWELLKGRGS